MQNKSSTKWLGLTVSVVTVLGFVLQHVVPHTAILMDNIERIIIHLGCITMIIACIKGGFLYAKYHTTVGDFKEHDLCKTSYLGLAIMGSGFFFFPMIMSFIVVSAVEGIDIGNPPIYMMPWVMWYYLLPIGALLGMLGGVFEKVFQKTRSLLATTEV